MLLVLDIGNTDVVFGLFNEKELIGHWRVASHLHKTSDEYAILLIQILKNQNAPLARIEGAIISSVVPPLTPVFCDVVSRYFGIEALVISSEIETGLRIRCDHPEEVGSDRIVNATAAYDLIGGPVIIVDLGTATTFCIVNQEGDYLGGAIAPGLTLSMEALVGRTAKLPRVALQAPETVIGKNTISSMQSGIFFGHVGLIDEIVGRIQSETQVTAPVIATGGLAPLIAPHCKSITKIHSTLTLLGLMIIYGLNTGDLEV